jgi:hypothetical protein
MIEIKIFFIVEGQTEARFIKKVLSPWFYQQYGAILIPCIVVTKLDKQLGRQYKGGVSSYSKIKSDINKYIKNTDSYTYVTTMFDYYRLPDDTPGYKDAYRISNPYEKIACLEKAMKSMIDADKRTNFFPYPYIQLHEFESLLFSDINMLCKRYFDDGKNTAPSKRIISCISDFNKISVGVDTVYEIGLTKLRERCIHFNEWGLHRSNNKFVN